jgi:hypothetical protein
MRHRKELFARPHRVCVGGLRRVIVVGAAIFNLAVHASAAGATNASVVAGANAEPLRSFAPPKTVNYRDPERRCVQTNLVGWTLYLEQELVARHPALARAATRRLGAKLTGVLDLLPTRTHELLRRLPIFLLLGEESSLGGRDNGAEYFQRDAPKFWPLLDRRWSSALVIYSARNYQQLSEEWATRVLVHELAHAWQLEQWPEKQPDILGAWEHAVHTGLYTHVKAVNGTMLDRAYALENQLEYFAELSCAYFWRGEYAPFDRAALRQYDPAGFAMIEQMWGVHAPPPP